MRDNSGRLFPGVRNFHRAVYNAMDVILTVSERDAEHFRKLRLSKPVIHAVGDTRYDRVSVKAEESRRRMPLPAQLLEGKRTLVIGSSWSEDEEVVLPVLFKLLQHDPTLQCIIVPHEPTLDHLEFLEYRLADHTDSIRFSYMHTWNGERVIIVDSIGILLPLYAAADVAFVGGGFRSNVHNTLEPAAYGIPVLYGPKIGNSQEARELAEAGGGFVVHTKQECYKKLRQLIDDESLRAVAGGRAGAFVRERSGSTEHILAHLIPLLQKT
jgi:3-deoxy-D-manno-octulosonic-acid transferase